MTRKGKNAAQDRIFFKSEKKTVDELVRRDV